MGTTESAAVPKGRAWRPWAAAVVPLTVVSGAMLGARIAFDGDTFQHCDYLGPSTRMWVTAWAGPSLAVVALLLLAVAVRLARTAGDRVTRHAPGNLAVVAACVLPVLLLVQGALLYWTLDLPAHGPGCEGLAVLPGG